MHWSNQPFRRSVKNREPHMHEPCGPSQEHENIRTSCWFALLTSVKTLSPLTVAVHATQSNPLLHALQHSTSWSMAPGSSTPGCSCFSISVRSPDWQETLARSAKSHLTVRNWTQITKSHFKLQYLSTSFHSQVVRPKNLLPSTLPPNLILNNLPRTLVEYWIHFGGPCGWY